MLRYGYDVVNGIVIGEMEKGARLFYDNREQGGRFHCKNDDEIKEHAKEIIAEIKQEMGKEHFNKVYPEQKWEIRIYD